MRVRAVSFDFGQTLAGLDPVLLAAKLAPRAVAVAEDRIAAALPAAWGAYDRAVRAGVSGHPWKLFMRTLLEEAAAEPLDLIGAAVDFLWDDQPRHNLWRSPIPGVIELCREMRDRGVRTGVLSNSEGRMDELLQEMGWRADFDVVIDSGRIGIEKPDPRIFAAFSDAIGVDAAAIVHVGDNLGADVQGALGAGMQAIWFAGRPEDAPLGAVVCADAAALAAELRRRT